jgi:hypothetical protein
MSWKQAHASLLVESFPKTPSEASWFGGSHNYKTKQTTFPNKLPFLHRYTSVACTIGPSVNPFSTDFSFQNLVFWNLLEFSSSKNHIKTISTTF